MASVLIGLAFPLLSRIISIHTRRGRQQGSAGVNVQVNVVGQPDAAAQVNAGGKPHRSSASVPAGANGCVDRWAVERFAVANRSEVADVIDCCVPSGFLAPQVALIQERIHWPEPSNESTSFVHMYL